jgi:hypothetical protein
MYAYVVWWNGRASSGIMVEWESIERDDRTEVGGVEGRVEGGVERGEWGGGEEGG